MAKLLADEQQLSNSGDATFLEQFRPTPLSWLVAWLFRSRQQQASSEPEQFEEHINGLA